MLITLDHVIGFFCAPPLILVLRFFGNKLQYLKGFSTFRNLPTAKKKAVGHTPVSRKAKLAQLFRCKELATHFVRMHCVEEACFKRNLCCGLPSPINNKTTVLSIIVINLDNLTKFRKRRSDLVRPTTNWFIDYVYACGVEK